MKKTVSIWLSILLCLILGGCYGALFQKELSSEEAVEAFLTAYQQGDAEGMKPYIGPDNQLHFMIAALEGEGAGEMGQVYKLAHELTKDLTFTAQAVEGKEAWGEVLVKIQSKDIAAGIPQAMWSALQAQTEGGGDSFSNLPSWLLPGLLSGDPVEEEITVYVGSRDGNTVMDTNANREFFEALTGGFYDYIDITMTTCTAPDHTIEIAALGDNIVSSLETTQQAGGAKGLTEEEIQQWEDSYAEIKGVSVHAQKDENENLLFRFGVDYESASSTALENLGIINRRITASGGYISLRQTVSGFEGNGMECVTNDFGSGVLSGEE